MEGVRRCGQRVPRAECRERATAGRAAGGNLQPAGVAVESVPKVQPRGEQAVAHADAVEWHGRADLSRIGSTLMYRKADVIEWLADRFSRTFGERLNAACLG